MKSEEQIIGQIEREMYIIDRFCYFHGCSVEAEKLKRESPKINELIEELAEVRKKISS